MSRTATSKFRQPLPPDGLDPGLPDQRAIDNGGDGSLRARKKARQRVELLRAAESLFREKGYEATRMDEIATRSEVATKTVYNYFSTKQDLLIALLDEDRHRTQAAYEAIVSNPPNDPAEALARLIHADLGDVVSREDKRYWRELLAASMRGHENPEDEFEANRRLFTQHIERVLRHFQEQGAISDRLDLQVAVDLIYAVNAYDFRYFCASAVTHGDVLALARRQMRLLIDTWNEPAHQTVKGIVDRSPAARRRVKSR